MKRLVILFLAVLAVLSAVLGTTLAVGATQDRLTHEETVLLGDAAAAEGLEVSLRYSYESYLQWYADRSYGREVSDRVDFRCHMAAPNFPYSKGHHIGVYMEVTGTYSGMDSLSDLYRMELSRNPQREYPGLLGAYQKLYEATAEGELTNTYLRFADHCEYYPLAGYVDLPTGGYVWNIYSSGGYLAQEELAKAFNDYFKIPVLPDDQLQVVVDKRRGNVLEAVEITNNRIGEDWFDMRTVGVCHENTAYFTFDARTHHENLVDTSQIPGGYGLYSFTYDEKGNVDLSSITTRCPLDPTFAPYEMQIDPEFGNLLYFTTKGESIYLTVIDLETMKILQHSCLLTAEELGWQYYKLLDNCIVTVSEDKAVGVWEKQEGGLFAHRFTAAIPEEDYSEDLYSAAFAFDGERLAVCNWIEGQYIVAENIISTNPVSGYSVKIYTADGCAYSSRCISSLEPKDTRWYDQRCWLRDFSISWK